jgi:hypothetical protein
MNCRIDLPSTSASCKDAPVRLFAILLPILALAACHRVEEENIQAEADNRAEQLQQRYNQLQAEAEKDQEAAPADNPTNLFGPTNGANSQ